MLKMIKGCKIKSSGLLREEYEKSHNLLIANVDADKIEKVLMHFIKMQNGPLFFILELPASIDDERALEQKVESFHKKVYYIDGLDTEKAISLLLQSGELLINDGLCSFGFGVHGSRDEIMAGKYNIVTVYSDEIENYEGFFKHHNIPKTDNLNTAWDTFSQENPGRSIKFEIDGRSVYSLIDEYRDWGIYYAEMRED